VRDGFARKPQEQLSVTDRCAPGHGTAAFERAVNHYIRQSGLLEPISDVFPVESKPAIVLLLSEEFELMLVADP
jgi:hypothetical protein